MPFTIPNAPSAAVNPAPVNSQAQLDSGDISIIIAGQNGTGVVTGFQVSPMGGMAIQWSAGYVTVQNIGASVSASNIVLAASDPTNDRYDLIQADVNGNVTVLQGVPGISPDFTALLVDSNGNLTHAYGAAIRVAALSTSIIGANIIDKRAILPNSGTFHGGWLNINTITGQPVLTLSSNWGISSHNGQPYYNASGALSNEVAFLLPDLSLVAPYLTGF